MKKGRNRNVNRRVAEILGATVKVEIEYKKSPEVFSSADHQAAYTLKKSEAKSKQKFGVRPKEKRGIWQRVVRNGE